MENSEPQSSPESAEPEVAERRNYFVRLFTGDVPLVQTYWIWGVLIGSGVLRAANLFVEHNYAKLITKDYGASLITAFGVAVLAYWVYIWISIWRSAGKYEGEVWGPVAQVLVVIGVAYTGVMVVPTYLQDPNDESVIREEISRINLGLPTMLDESTRLESVSLQAKNIVYRHTIVDSTVDEYDVEDFVEIMWPGLQGSLCSEADTLDSLESGLIYTYSYRDKYGTEIADISVTEADCK